MASSVLEIANMALGRIGAEQITSLSDGSVQAAQINLHYEQTRDALLRSHFWRFASARVALVENSTAPDFEWANAFDLPDDFSRSRSVFDDNGTQMKTASNSYAIEGDQLLTNEEAVNLRYVKKVTEVGEFDSLFVEVLVLSLAIKIAMPLSGGDPKLKQEMLLELRLLMRQVRTIDKQETNTIGRADMAAWNNARWGTPRRDSKLGSSST